MASTIGSQSRLSIYTIAKGDFPDQFSGFKEGIGEYIDVQIMFQEKEDLPNLQDFWTLHHLITDLPFCLDEGVSVERALDARIEHFLSFFKTDDSIISSIFRKRVLGIIDQPISAKRIVPNELKIVEFPWAHVPVHKSVRLTAQITNDARTIEKAGRTQGSIGILLAAMYERGFLAKQNAMDLYPIFSLLTGYSAKSWPKAFALNMTTLLKRGFEVSEKDILAAIEFLDDTRKSIIEIREGQGKSRRRKKNEG